MNPKRNKGPEHISKLIQEAKKEWLKTRAEIYMNSPQFAELKEVQSVAGIEIMFLYIDGDPNYIRTIFLN